MCAKFCWTGTTFAMNLVILGNLIWLQEMNAINYPESHWHMYTVTTEYTLTARLLSALCDTSSDNIHPTPLLVWNLNLNLFCLLVYNINNNFSPGCHTHDMYQQPACVGIGDYICNQLFLSSCDVNYGDVGARPSFRETSGSCRLWFWCYGGFLKRRRRL